jgi:hypothetical protein
VISFNCFIHTAINTSHKRITNVWSSWENRINVNEYKLVLQYVPNRVVILFYSLCFYLYCRWTSNYFEWEQWDSIKRCNPATLLCLSQNRIWISIVICHSIFYVQWFDVNISCSFCWYCWPCLDPLVYLLPKPFKLFCFPILSTLSVPDEGYSRNASCALNLVSTCSLNIVTISYIGGENNCVEKSKNLSSIADCQFLLHKVVSITPRTHLVI